MKSMAVSAGLIVVLGILIASSASAGEKPAATQPVAVAEAPATQPAATQPVASAVPFNKFCPISGDKINPKGKTIVYKGKVIGFCCDDCIDLFNKNPEKYFAKLK